MIEVLLGPLLEGLLEILVVIFSLAGTTLLILVDLVWMAFTCTSKAQDKSESTMPVDGEISTPVKGEGPLSGRRLDAVAISPWAILIVAVVGYLSVQLLVQPHRKPAPEQQTKTIPPKSLGSSISVEDAKAQAQRVQEQQANETLTLITEQADLLTKDSAADKRLSVNQAIDIRDAWGSELVITYTTSLTHEKLDIRSLGPDGILNTVDDVHLQRSKVLPARKMAAGLFDRAKNTIAGDTADE